jgi:Leucine-rich repeat (LRR) protein
MLTYWYHFRPFLFSIPYLNSKCVCVSVCVHYRLLLNKGDLEGLEVLDIRDNTIKNAPMSLTRLANLVEFRADNNRMHELPSDMGNMKKLEILTISSNELDSVPHSIVDCEMLKVLKVNDNHIRRLPPELGTLKKLEVLNVSANGMKGLPFSLGFCKTLKEFQVDRFQDSISYLPLFACSLSLCLCESDGRGTLIMRHDLYLSSPSLLHLIISSRLL